MKMLGKGRGVWGWELENGRRPLFFAIICDALAFLCELRNANNFHVKTDRGAKGNYVELVNVSSSITVW